jgi:hypothetical protein
MAWAIAERARRGQPWGSGTGKGGATRRIGNLAKKSMEMGRETA